MPEDIILNEAVSSIATKPESEVAADIPAARELGSPMQGRQSFKFEDTQQDEIVVYAPEDMTFKQAKRVWSALSEQPHKYKAGMLRPKNRVVPQILEEEDRGKDLFTPLPWWSHFRRKIAKWLSRKANKLHTSAMAGSIQSRRYWTD
jgi:hypothetical protein